MNGPFNTKKTKNPNTQPTLEIGGQRVVVVGGKSGIGLGIAIAAKRAGANVIVASRRQIPNSEKPELTDFEQITLDISDENAVRDAFQKMGSIDHLVVAAGPGFGSWGAFSDNDMSGVRSYLESKFLGTWACARYASPHIRPGGSITFMTGGTAARSKKGLAAVTSTFAAIEALARSLALEIAPIRVNTLRPGFIDTDLWNTLPGIDLEQLKEKVREHFPVHRVGTPADVGHAALFLMTNPYTTGTVLEVSGGELLVDWLF